MAELNIRIIPEFDNDEVIALFKETAEKYNSDGADIEIDVTMSLPSVYTDGKSRLVELSKELCEKYLGLEIKVESSPGVTDASNLLRNKDEDFPFMMFGPGETKWLIKWMSMFIKIIISLSLIFIKN